MKKLTIRIGILIFAFILFLWQGIGFADLNSHRRAAGKLLETMDLNTLLSGSIESVLKLQMYNNPTLLPFEEIMRTFLNKHMSGENLKDAYINIYVDTFTEEELIQITEFYKTPTGQKTLRETPDLLSKGAKLGQQRVKENLPELQKMIEAEASRIQKMQQDSQ